MIHASANASAREPACVKGACGPATRGQQRAASGGRSRRRGGALHLDEVLPLLLAGADGLLDAAQLGEDGLSLVQLVVGLTARHLPVDPDTQMNTKKMQHLRRSESCVVSCHCENTWCSVISMSTVVCRLGDTCFFSIIGEKRIKKCRN